MHEPRDRGKIFGAPYVLEDIMLPDVKLKISPDAE
jgi:hypothetical protein